MEKKSHERLDRYINERRLELRLKLNQVADLAGISVPTLTALRKGTNIPTEDTKHGVERALQWTPGSIDRILAGGEPGRSMTGVGGGPATSEARIQGHATSAEDESALDRTIEALARALGVTPDEVRERMGIEPFERDERSTKSGNAGAASEDYSRLDRKYEKWKRDPGPNGRLLRIVLDHLGDQQAG